jgi:hypothetical protein
MLRSVSHELKTPPNSLIYLLSKARCCKQLSQELQKDLDVAANCSFHLNFVIDDLLDYSSHIQGTLTLNKSRFDVHEALVKCVKLFKIHSAYYGINLGLHICTGVKHFIFNDSKRLCKVVMSLLNCIFKSVRGGRVLVALKQISSNKLGLSFTCHDEGHFKTKLLTLLAFSQEADDGNSLSDTSLGFRICNSLALLLGESPLEVSQHEGELKVQLAITMTEFNLMSSESGFNELDLDEDFVMSSVKSNRFINSREAVAPFLVVDDNSFNRLVITGMLGQMGFACDEAQDGAQAVEMIKVRDNQQYKVVILDYEMPGHGWTYHCHHTL